MPNAGRPRTARAPGPTRQRAMTDRAARSRSASVSKRYPGVLALADVSFDIRGGRTAGHRRRKRRRQEHADENPGRRDHRLRGRNRRCAASAVRFRSTRDAEQPGVSIIHQELNLVEQLSAAANIFLGRELRSRLGLVGSGSDGAPGRRIAGPARMPDRSAAAGARAARRRSAVDRNRQGPVAAKPTS